MHIPETKGLAVITGASSGIGALYAARLARRGYELILVARSRERLEAVARRIQEVVHRSIETISADLSDPGDLERFAVRLQGDTGITMLVNNAGTGTTSTLLDSDPGDMARMIALNVTALVRLTHAVAPTFVTRGSGTIINIASITAVAPELLNGVYGATKAFVLAFSQSLHHELASRGVRIQAVLPGPTATDFWEKAGLPHQRLPAQWVMAGEDMVDAAMAGLDLGELVTIPSLPDVADWEAFEAARLALGPNLSHMQPAERYAPAFKAQFVRPWQ